MWRLVKVQDVGVLVFCVLSPTCNVVLCRCSACCLPPASYVSCGVLCRVLIIRAWPLDVHVQGVVKHGRRGLCMAPHVAENQETRTCAAFIRAVAFNEVQCKRARADILESASPRAIQGIRDLPVLP